MNQKNSKPRVNTSTLSLQQGQQVCLLGMANNVSKDNDRMDDHDVCYSTDRQMY